MRRFLLLVAAVLALTGAVGGFHIGPASASEAGDTMVKVLVHVDGASPAAATDRVLEDLADAGTRPQAVDRYESIPWLAVDVPQRALAVLDRSDAVAGVVVDRVHAV